MAGSGAVFGMLESSCPASLVAGILILLFSKALLMIAIISSSTSAVKRIEPSRIGVYARLQSFSG